MRSLFNKIESVGELLGRGDKSVAALLKNPRGSPMRVGGASKEIVAIITNPVGFLHGILGERHFFVAATRAEQKTAASTKVPLETRENSHAVGSHANFRECIRQDERGLYWNDARNKHDSDGVNIRKIVGY